MVTDANNYTPDLIAIAMRIARLNRPRTFSIDAAASCWILLYSVHSAGLNNIK